MDSEAGLATRYELIPADTDIIVSHGPPHTCGDLTLSGSHVGSKALLAAIERVRPKAVFCGHIHEAAGAYERCGHGHRTPVYNVSVVDECYQMVHEPTVLHDSDLAPYPSLAEIEGQ
jgi:hypothetical protein